MSFISEAHTQWHMIYGHDAVCPLDCGAGETHDDYDPDPQGGGQPVEVPDAPAPIWPDPWIDLPDPPF